MTEPQAEAVEALTPAERERERRIGRWAGLAGLLAVVLALAGLVAAGRAVPSTLVRSLDDSPQSQRERERAAQRRRTGEVAPLDPVDQLRNFHRGEGGRLAAQALRTGYYLLMIPLGLFLYGAAKRRNPDTSQGLRVLGVAAPVAVAVVGVATYLAFQGYVERVPQRRPDGRARA